MKYVAYVVLFSAWVFGLAIAVKTGGFWFIVFSFIPLVAYVNDVIWLMGRFGGGL